MGNPNALDGWSFTWEHGRDLATMSNGTTTWTNTYNADGLRTKRTNGRATYSYVYTGSSLLSMTVSGNTLYFNYDAAGTPLTVTYNGTTYYYATNLQGDIVGILDSTGTTVVSYTYDAWGNPASTTGSLASTLGTVNPLRYRGYVYDTETRLYYLQTRYYNPRVCRFLNSDNYPVTGQGFVGNNMFAYCGNMPVNNIDVSGEFFFTALGAVTGFIGSAIAAAASGLEGEELLAAACCGAIGGAIAGAGVDTGLLIVGTLGTAAPAVALAVGVTYLAGGVGNAYTTYATSGGTATDEELTFSFHAGGIANLFSLYTCRNLRVSSTQGLLAIGIANYSSNLITGLKIATVTAYTTSVGIENSRTSTTTTPNNASHSNALNKKLWLMEERMGHR